MSTNDTDEEIRRVCSILESIANNYPPESDEHLAIRDAACAYSVVQQHKAVKKVYQQLILACRGQLPEETKARLRQHGIEPDDFDDEDNPKP